MKIYCVEQEYCEKYVFWSILSISRDQSDVPYQSKYKPTIGTEPSNLNVMLC